MKLYSKQVGVPNRLAMVSDLMIFLVGAPCRLARKKKIKALDLN